MHFLKLSLLSTLMLPIAPAQLPLITNPDFANVAIQCASGFAYQSIEGGTCTGQSFPQQAFNGAAGIGWEFSSHVVYVTGSGLTNPGGDFDPPSFEGLQFTRAAFLQGANSGLAQTISGFVPGAPYRLSFYLGSRYAEGGVDGNQTVQVLIDNKIIGTWALVSFTPFTLQHIYFMVDSSGPHKPKIVGLTSGDHTAFFSGVRIAGPSGAR